MKKLNFVFVSLQRIHTDRDSTSTNIAKELAKEHNVLYVNAPIDRKTYYFGDQNKYVQEHVDQLKNNTNVPLVRSENNLWVLNPNSVIESLNWIPFTRIFQLFNYNNNRTFSKEIQQALNELGFDRFILINDKDIFRSFYLKHFLKPLLYVYLDRDYTIAMDYWKRHGASLEPKLMAKADLILCNSTGFRKRALKYNPRSYYIGNGCNVALFNGEIKHARPKKLSKIKGPIIGYIGAIITLRLDINLITALAKNNPAWNFIFIGPEDEVFRGSNLHHLENVYFLGKIDTEEAPAYIQHFDVGINPQSLNPITQFNYPLKVDEYLAMGIPVVATKTDTMVDVFSDYIYMASDKDEFAAKIQQALNENAVEKKENRIAFARKHNWKNVTDKVKEIILDALT